MAKGDTASRIAQGIQPGLVPLQNGPKPVSNPSLAPTFAEESPMAQPTNKGKHSVGTRPSLMKQYNNVR